MMSCKYGLMQIISIRDVIPPPQREAFNDVYIAYELMDTDLHQIIRSNQALSEEHCQVLYLVPRIILKNLCGSKLCHHSTDSDRLHIFFFGHTFYWLDWTPLFVLFYNAISWQGIMSLTFFKLLLPNPWLYYSYFHKEMYFKCTLFHLSQSEPKVWIFVSLIIIIDDFHFLATWKPSNAPIMRGLAQNDTLTKETKKGGFFFPLVHSGSIGVNVTLIG